MWYLGYDKLPGGTMFTHTWLSSKLSATPFEKNTVLCIFRAARKQDMKAFLKKEDCVEEINVQTTKMSLRQKNKRLNIDFWIEKGLSWTFICLP